jgi:hypothetical protein
MPAAFDQTNVFAAIGCAIAYGCVSVWRYIPSGNIESAAWKIIEARYPGCVWAVESLFIGVSAAISSSNEIFVMTAEPLLESDQAKNLPLERIQVIMIACLFERAR